MRRDFFCCNGVLASLREMLCCLGPGGSSRHESTPSGRIPDDSYHASWALFIIR